MNGWKGVFDLVLCNENVEKTSQSDDKRVEKYPSAIEVKT